MRKQNLITKDQEQSDDQSSNRRLSHNDLAKKAKYEVQNNTINVHKSKIVSTRRNIYIVTLMQHVKSAVANMKNTFDMAMAINLMPMPSKPICEYNNLKDKQKIVDNKDMRLLI